MPQGRWQDAVDAGATPTTGVDLARRLNASGLRLRKRKRDRGVRRILAVPFPNGVSDVDLVASDDPLDPARVLAAMVFVRDRRGDFVVVHSIRRGEWGSPGGWREDDETPVENAVRETFEETGLRLRHHDVLPCGYERFTPLTDDNLFGRDKPFLQVFRTRLDDVRPEPDRRRRRHPRDPLGHPGGVRRGSAATSSGGPSRSRSSPTCAVSPARSRTHVCRPLEWTAYVV